MARVRLLLVGLVCLVACFPSVKEERDTGREMSAQVESQIGLYPTPARKWCASIGERLVANLDAESRSRWPFTFDVVDQEEPNAFALPGGPIYVSRGLLALVVTEDELACVLGHEITHVTERHSTARARQSVLPAIFTIPGRIVGVVVDEQLGGLIAAPFEVIGGLGLAKYSREQESESDRKGAALAARAGYDPRALGRILDRLEKDATRLAGKERKESFFDSHPSTPTRVADVTKEAKDIRWTPQPPLRSWPEVLATLDGLAWGQNPAQGVFIGPQFLHPDLDLAVRFPNGWRTVNTPSVVGATRGEDAVVALGAAAPGADPQSEGRAFSKRLRDKGTTPDEEHPVTVNGYPGYVVRVSSARSDSRAFSLWVRMREQTFQIVGMGPAKDQAALWGTATTLRPVRDEERAAIRVVRLHAARATAGDTLESVSTRSDNFWPPSYTGLVNATPESARLDDGTLVKVARSEPYVSRPRPPSGRD